MIVALSPQPVIFQPIWIALNTPSNIFWKLVAAVSEILNSSDKSCKCSMNLYKPPEASVPPKTLSNAFLAASESFENSLRRLLTVSRTNSLPLGLDKFSINLLKLVPLVSASLDNSFIFFISSSVYPILFNWDSDKSSRVSFLPCWVLLTNAWTSLYLYPAFVKASTLFWPFP